MIVQINLMSQEWVQYMVNPDGLKGALRATLWEAGWRDGTEVTWMRLAPNIITYTFDTITDKV